MITDLASPGRAKAERGVRANAKSEKRAQVLFSIYGWMPLLAGGQLNGESKGLGGRGRLFHVEQWRKLEAFVALRAPIPMRDMGLPNLLPTQECSTWNILVLEPAWGCAAQLFHVEQFGLGGGVEVEMEAAVGAFR